MTTTPAHAPDGSRAPTVGLDLGLASERVLGDGVDTDVIRRADGLRGLLAANAPRCEAERRVPQDNLDALAEAGLYDVLAPKRVGGSGASMATQLAVASSLARGCPSTAWIQLPRRRYAMVGLAIMVLLSCGGGGGDDEARDRGGAGRREQGVVTRSTTGMPTTTTSPPTTAPPSTIPVGPIGEIVSNGGWALMVHGVTYPYGPAGNASGERLTLIDVEVTHTGQGGATSLKAFDNFRLTGVGELPMFGMDVQGMPSIAGPLTGDASRRGTIAFLGDAEVTGMQLRFRPSLLDGPLVAVQIS